MSNTERRKLAKLSKGTYITPLTRLANKIADGKSVRLLSHDERRYVAKMNRFFRKSGGEWVHPEQLLGS